MAVSGFGERLRREIARNKAKSAALAVLCVVACYFWLPLVTKFFNKKKTPPPVVQTADVTSVLNETPIEPVSDAPNFDWKQFLTWMASEPRMTVMTVSPETRDPFSSSMVQRAAPASQNAFEPTASSSVADEASDTRRDAHEAKKDPKSCGLQLHSTFIGARRTSANVNGTTYRKGDWIPIADTSEDPTLTDGSDGFQLLEVKTRFVTLQRNGELFRLDLHEPQSVDQKISIGPASP